MIIKKIYFLTTFLLSILIFGSPKVQSSSIDDSWGVVRSQFRLNHELSHPQVQEQIHWLIKHPNYLKKLSQAEPFIYHIITEIQKRNLPGELALIPMLESTYNPFAYSGAGAAGLWQLMPKTGQNLGVKGDWWVDDRRNIHSSTNAALNYLNYLQRFFKGDWLLAIAAYDCGEGTIQRQIKANPPLQQSFWYLNLPQETAVYVPRLLALSEVIAHPERYNIRLPYVPHRPFFTEVHVNTQLDLNHAAHLAGISLHDLIKLNPGYNHWATSPNKTSKLLIPAKNASQFSENLSRLPKNLPSSFKQHMIQNGETLSQIAYRYHSNPKLLMQINHMQNSAVKPGQTLNIPSIITLHQQIKHPPIPIAPKQYKILHIVQNQDNLESLAQKYHTTITAIINWNQLSHKELTLGQKLIIWRQTDGNSFYVVHAGDTLNQIAKKYDISIAMLEHLNPQIKNHLLHPGDKLRIC